MILNLFYEEPVGDRWFPYDRYPRSVIRRLVRGKPRMGGHRAVFLNLLKGLDQLGVRYRVNDYKYAQSHSGETACIIGRPFVLDKIAWQNPIIFGAAVYSHPSDDPNLLKRLDIRKILVPGEWMRKMCAPAWGDKVVVWPVGIDTDLWQPQPNVQKQFDFLLYNKIRWNHDQMESQLVQPLRDELDSRGLKFAEVRYGAYHESDFHQLLGQCKAMIFLCEHETQGIAYQQALSCGVPILAWDREGEWGDPYYYPHKVRFGPVTSVPYWDNRCGLKFKDASDFSRKMEEFAGNLRAETFDPRSYVLDNLTIKKCAQDYIDICLNLAS